MKKNYTLIFIVCLLSGSLSYGQKASGTLLWRISGNGLQKPSFLFGTMHLTDDRLFNLGDSLLKAIEISDGFAIEVNPDELTPFIAGLIKKEIRDQYYIKDILSEKDYKKYGVLLSKKFNKEASEITTQDILQEKNKWVNESFQNGKSPTFLDIYLFDLARRQGKWTGGVEDIADQAGLVDDMVDESDIRQIASGDDMPAKTGMNTLINAYVNSDLNAIENMMELSDSAYTDALLVKRNKKMAWRMDSLSHVRSMVFAVGAAHLPGKAGLIDLLQKRGFSVEPVFYSKKIKPEDYRLKKVDIPWVDVSDPNGFYTVMMPAKPSDIQLFGMLNMKVYFNVFTSTLYMVYAVGTPYGQNGVDSLVNVFAENVFKVKKMSGAKAITISNIPGKELEKTDAQGYRHGYILYRNNELYLAVAFSKGNNPESMSDIKKFLASYQPVENKINDNAVSKMYTLSDPVFAYSIQLPSVPQSGNELGERNDKTTRSDLKICVDQQTGSYFIIGVNETRPGYFIVNDSASLEILRERLKDQYKKVFYDTAYIKDHRRISVAEGLMAKANVNAKTYYEMRGNRWYAIIAMYTPGKSSAAVDKVLNTFKLLDYQHAVWRDESATNHLFSTWAPSKILYVSKDTSDANSLDRYAAYDSMRSNSYVIAPEGFDKYFWKQNDSSFWASLVDAAITYKDTLLSKRKVYNGNVQGIEIEKREKGSSQITRKRMFLYGDSLYSLFTTQAEEGIHQADINRFFDEFTFKKEAPPSHVLESKAKELLEDISSGDSATRAAATEHLNRAEFVRKEIPLLHQAILKTYKQFDDYYQNTNERIAKKLISMHDTASLLFARAQYLQTPDQNVKNALLDIISSFKTASNFQTMASLLIKSPPSDKPSYTFRNNLKDSFSLTASVLYPTILPLLADTTMIYPVLDISASLLDSNRISINMFSNFESTILGLAAKRYVLLKADSSNYLNDDIHLLHVLQKFNDKAANDMLRKWLLISENYLRLECVRMLISNKQQVSQLTLLKLAKDKLYRVDLYEALAKYNKQILFPRIYLSQSRFAESLIYTKFSEDDDDAIPEAIIPVSQKTILFKGQMSKFYFFKLVFDQDEKKYELAGAGPFNPNPEDVSVKKAFGAVYYKEDFDAKQLKEQSDALIKEIEREGDDQDE